ncbi:hypothetical protein GJ700_08700 [Duganella sp. FT92W]|uniref:Uncharacterized protein n=2 Tax=Pseudoduganella rivuli TaxID=2666085 RepID=A0A7X2LTB1_9BURK|nr:hypothetical protein [Pseudoduganella rivuli]
MSIFPAYRGPSMSVTVTTDGHRIHRLADDRPNYGRVKTCVIRRDPMVAALFGAPAAPRTRVKDTA